MTLKKVLPPIIIAVVVLTALLGPFKANAITYFCNNPVGGLPIEQDTPCPGAAEGGMGEYGANDNPNGSCNPLYWNFENCVLSAAAGITYYAIWTPANLFLSLGGIAMDASISLTINGSIFSDLVGEENGVVATGWGISRDIVNMFLIFILLYIAIATILQVSGYGAKELLATLIVIAFLVNFSLVITKMIIDASNVLAAGFYNAFSPTNGEVQISNVFKKSFDAEDIITQVKAAEEATNLKNLYIVQFLTYLLGAGIAAVAGFIFLVFSVLFVIRMVSLLILMILAPLAFGAMVLPGTKSHAKKWWSTLLSQAFFAPAGLFMLYLSAKMATSMNSLLKNAYGLGNAGIADMLIDAQNNTANWANIGKFILQFVIIAIILVVAIIVSKQIGAMGADSAISGVKKGLSKAQGYAGRIGKYTGTRVGGPLAERVLEGKGGAAAFMRSIPLVTRGLAGVSAMEQKRVKEKGERYEKAYGTYSEAGLQAMLKTPIIMPTKRKAIEHVLAKRAEEAAQKKAKEKAKREGKPTDVISMLTEALKAELKTELKGEMKAEKPASPPPSATPKTP